MLLPGLAVWAGLAFRVAGPPIRVQEFTFTGFRPKLHARRYPLSSGREFYDFPHYTQIPGSTGGALRYNVFPSLLGAIFVRVFGIPTPCTITTWVFGSGYSLFAGHSDHSGSVRALGRSD